MNIVINTIEREIHNQNARFVFPSDIAASLWPRRICEILGLRSLARNRFLAWDRFKEWHIRSDVQDKEPVSKEVRQLFVLDLIRRNAAAPLLHWLIPSAYSAEGAIFADELATLLPSLGALREREVAHSLASPLDEEDRDYLILEKEYRDFLNAFKLFEPAWEKPPLKDREHDYYIFFPGAMEDFVEYEAVLDREPNIHIVHSGDLDEKEGTQEPPQFYRFASSIEEIRAVVAEIRRIHQEMQMPFEDMALSIPGLETLEPYLMQELTLHDIPVRRRQGYSLGKERAGRLFALLQGCVANSFSFDSLKSLVLNEQIPWQNIENNRALIQFGIENHCVSAYHEADGSLIDVWQEAFERNRKDADLYQYYLDLKRSAQEICGAVDFTGIRKSYFKFFNKYLSREDISPLDDAILARCIEELSALIYLEETYRDYLPASPYAMYLSILTEKRYVPQQENIGVNIFNTGLRQLLRTATILF